jgi:hypothetical protein
MYYPFAPSTRRPEVDLVGPVPDSVSEWEFHEMQRDCEGQCHELRWPRTREQTTPGFKKIRSELLETGYVFPATRCEQRTCYWCRC